MEKLSKAAAFLRKFKKTSGCGAVVVAAGSARRMDGVDKVMADLNGKPLFLHCVESLERCGSISEIVLVTRQDLILPIHTICRDAGLTKVTAVIAGGDTRQASVARGLSCLAGRVKLAAIHDAARPLASEALIERTVRAAQSVSAAAPALPVKDTIKVAKGGVVQKTPDRNLLFAVQTPQVFDFDLIRGALRKAEEENAVVTDDCSAVEQLGVPVKLVEGEERNFKVTTPMDLALARMLLQEETT